MSEPTNWALLARYLADECSAAESNRIEAWIDSDPENQQLVKMMETVWQTPEMKPEASDVKDLWKRVELDAGIAARTETVGIRESLKRIIKWREWPFNLTPASYPALRYAALLLVIVAIPYIYSRMGGDFFRISGSSGLNYLHVQNGERGNLTLSDGTKITLDSGSSLSYPEKFDGHSREVILDGEGYFEVAKDVRRPFIIHANNALITVLGTKFNVRAWEVGKRVRVAVKEGKVSLGPEGNGGRSVVISDGELSTLPEDGLPTRPASVDVSMYTAWMHNEVIFEDTPLYEVLFQLERWYDLRFDFADPSVKQERVTIHIRDKSINDNLKLIAALTDLQFERDGRFIHFKRKEAS